jgi:tetratricopeptide (TPR) repeat protein
MDDRAPAVLVNFHQAFVDDRKYREMRSRLAASAGRELVTVAKSDEPPLAESGGERDRARDEKKGQKKTIPASLARGSSATPLDFGKVRFESGIPIREREPDLSSTGACCQMLEIPAGATTEEVAKAFRTKAKLYHPDKTRHLSERLQQLAAEEFQRVFRAYEMLTRRTTRPLVGIRWAEGVPYHETPYEYTVEEYEKLSAVNPGNTSILYNLAWKYFEASQYQDSIQGFQRVLEINPSDDDASYNLMIVRLFVELQLPAPL